MATMQAAAEANWRRLLALRMTSMAQSTAGG